MRKLIILFAGIFFLSGLYGQELNCEVVVNAGRVVSGSPQLFKTLETSISEFVNDTRWTDKTFLPQERINCSMIINIDEEVASNVFKATLQVQASRPVFNSIYTTPILNHNDKSFQFTYTEGEPLVFNPTSYQSELVSVISFYVYFILGLDADTFAPQGGNEYYRICTTIMDNVEDKMNKPGWKPNSNSTNRYQLITLMTDNSYSIFRSTLYTYHREGLDMMADKKKTAKENIKRAIIDLKTLNLNNKANILYRLFMDAKADEIVQIFSGGPMTDTVELRNVLNKISPTNAQKWAKIK